MSISLNGVTKTHVWKYYVKLSDFYAECVFCENKYIYIQIGKYAQHVRVSHREIWEYEDKRKKKSPWIYFKYLNQSYAQCIICDANVLPTFESAKNHLSSHEIEEETRKARGWPWKYCSRKDDFTVECNICHNKVSLAMQSRLNNHMKKMHSDKLQNTQETNDTVGSSECVPLFEIDTTTSQNIEIKKNLWKYCVKLSDFEAQCMFCENKYNYVSMESYTLHMKLCHWKIWKYEEKRKEELWIYFKYFDELYSQCIICDANFPSTLESAEKHLRLHSEKQRENHISRSWHWKYCSRRDDFVAECKLCHKNLALTIQPKLNCHIKKLHFDKLKNTSEANDTDSSECVSSLEIDTTRLDTTSLNIATKEHLWNYYVKLSDFEAQCMFCEDQYNYINTFYVNRHIQTCHKNIWEYEGKRKLITLWLYFKYVKKLYSQCIICNVDVLSKFKSAKSHLSSHSKKQREDHIPRSWPWKYCSRRDDFVVECNICYKNITLAINSQLNYHIKKIHLDKVENTQEANDTVDSSECVLSPEIETTVSLNINLNITRKNLWKYYIKLSDFEAQCMFCEEKYNYIKITNFNRHIQVCHRETWDYEQKRKLKELWIYFKYLRKLYSQCIICDENVVSTFKSAEDHLSLHSKNQRKNHVHRGWSWKYCSRKDDFIVKCNICQKNCSISIQPELDFHIKKIHFDKLKNTQKANNTVDSSECVSSLGIDTNMSLNIIIKQNLWKYYVKLSDFEAQCMFCENKYYYINTKNFRNHIQIRHKKIWEYEKKRKFKLWIYFKYFNKLYAQCIICNVNVRSRFLFARDHFNSHSAKQRKNHNAPNWPWKYCSRKDDFVVECNICERNSSLSIQSKLLDHITEIHSDKLENTPETNIVDSSKRVSSL